MRRRQFLAALSTGVAGALAGCSDPRASLRMDTVGDAEIAGRYAHRTTNMRDEHRRIAVEAIDDGSALDETVREPFDPDRPVGHDGRYYDLVHEVVGEREATRYGIEVDYDPDDSASEIGEIDYVDLPAVDREALDGLVPPDHQPPESEGYDVGRSAIYTPEEAEESVLVPDQEYDVVVHDGDRYLLSVGDGEPVTLTEYRYTAEQIAAGHAEMAGQVREQYRFGLSGLSEAQRKIVDAAREDEYREDEPSQAFRDLVGRFRSQEAIQADEYGGEWLVRYRGEDYWADLETPRDWRRATVARETPTDY